MKAARVSLFSLIAVNKSSVKSAILDIVENPFLTPPCSLHNKLCMYLCIPLFVGVLIVLIIYRGVGVDKLVLDYLQDYRSFRKSLQSEYYR